MFKLLTDGNLSVLTVAYVLAGRLDVGNTSSNLLLITQSGL